MQRGAEEPSAIWYSFLVSDVDYVSSVQRDLSSVVSVCLVCVSCAG